MKSIFITGGTGYIGSRLIEILIQRGHDVMALVRKGSEHKLPQDTKAVVADPFNASGFQEQIPPGAVFVQLLGVHHPSPHKKELFRQIDLQSVRTSADAAAFAGVSHFVYVSVAMAETNFMKDYQAVRRRRSLFVIEKFALQLHSALVCVRTRTLVAGNFVAGLWSC